MTNRRMLGLGAAVAALGVLATAGLAGKFNQVVEVGQKAPGWTRLIGVDDKYHSLADYKDAKVLVLVFTCNSCPVARAYEDRLMQFTKDYEGKSVKLVTINVNNIEPDRLPAMKERAASRGFNYPYLYDPTQQTARAYGATVTPHIFVLDMTRTIAFMGSMDDNQNTSRVTKQYLRDAVDALLAGRRPETTESQQFGCTIKYE